MSEENSYEESFEDKTDVALTDESESYVRTAGIGSITSDSDAEFLQEETSSVTESGDLFSNDESRIKTTFSDSDSQEQEASFKLRESSSSVKDFTEDEFEDEETEEELEDEETEDDVENEFSVHCETEQVTSTITTTRSGVATTSVVKVKRTKGNFVDIDVFEEVIEDYKNGTESNPSKNGNLAIVPLSPTRVLEATSTVNSEKRDGVACGEEDAGTERNSACNKSPQPLTEALRVLSISDSPSSSNKATPRQSRFRTSTQNVLESPYYTRLKARVIRDQEMRSRSESGSNDE